MSAARLLGSSTPCNGISSASIPSMRSVSRQQFVVLAQSRRGISELLKLSDKSGPDNRPPQLKKGKVSPMLKVPTHIPRPTWADNGKMPAYDLEFQKHNEEEIGKMRAAGSLAAKVLEHAGTLVRPGVTTDEIDRAVHAMTIEAGAYPSPLNYGNFPKSVCTSVNECLCHGIPDSRPLRKGDIVNIDVTVFLEGHHGDTSRMFYVGEVDEEAVRLCEATREGLNKAIGICGPGVPFKEIGRAIQTVADREKFKISKAFCGHGVGRKFHSAPSILHYRNNEPGVMEAGMTFTIEPQFTAGNPRERYWDDDWTAVTVDGSWSAQWEHTLLITDSGVDVLTAYE